VIFDGPPSHEPGRFIEIEDPEGKSIQAGEWIDRGDGYWALHLAAGDFAARSAVPGEKP
jgi:hypothetical protein